MTFPKFTRYIIIKLSKSKTKNELGKQQIISYKGTPVRLSADFSTETLEARREWDIQSAQIKNLPSKNTLPSKAVLQMKVRKTNKS